jgi:hypothetical protein
MKVVYVVESRREKEWSIVDDVVYESEAVADHVYVTLVTQVMQVSDDIEYRLRKLIFVSGHIEVPSRLAGEKK